MALDVHTVSLMSGSQFIRTDRAFLGTIPGIANAAGAGAGAAVVIPVSGLKDLPANYSVMINPGQDATWFVSGKTSTGFNVTLNPRLAANTLAAGTFDILIVY